MIHVVVEGEFDQKLISRILSDLPNSALFVVEAGNGRNAARPIARKYLIRNREPVAFVFDADTQDPPHAKQQERDLQDYFEWGGHGVPFRLIQFVPELEVVFFEEPRPLERILGRPLDLPTKVAGRFAPREMLRSLQGELGLRHRDELVDRLGVDDLRQLRSHEKLAKLHEFVQEQLPPISMAG